MSNKNIPRLYIDKELSKSLKINLALPDKHYIKNVLRSKIGSKIYLFNGINGEWQAEVMDKNCKFVICIRQKKKQISLKGPIIYFSLIKNQSMRILIEKTTELGVAKICPLVTERANLKKFNENKAFAYTKEASEVSERLNLPKIEKKINLKELLELINKKKSKLIFCNETKKDIHLSQYLKNNYEDNLSFLIGPEGGFSEKEKKMLIKNKNVVSVKLHDRVLRAETAAILALSIFNCYSEQNVKK